nr:DsbA family protein [Pseudomonas fluorescens]
MGIASLTIAQPSLDEAQLAQALKDNHEALFNDPSSPRLGAKDARVVLVSFIDYNCSVCKKFDPQLEKLIADNPEVAVILKPLAFRHESSRHAAKVALTAWKLHPGAFALLHQRLMAKNSAHDLNSIDAIQQYSGIAPPLTPLQETEDTLEKNEQLAQRLGVWGTPATLFGETMLVGTAPQAALEAAVKTLLKSAP